MTLSWPSFWAAFTRASIPPTSSAEVALFASVPPLELLLSLPESDGGEHAAIAVAALSATRATNQLRILTRPPVSWRRRNPGHVSTVRPDGPSSRTLIAPTRVVHRDDRWAAEGWRPRAYPQPRDRGATRSPVPLLRPAA